MPTELVPAFTAKCIFAGFKTTAKVEGALPSLLFNVLPYLDSRALVYIALSGKTIHVVVMSSPLWYRLAGFRLMSDAPPGFCPMLFFGLMRPSADLRNRALLSSDVVNEKRSGSSKLTQLVLSSDDTKSMSFWKSEFVRLLSQERSPTIVQGQELQEVVKLLVQKLLAPQAILDAALEIAPPKRNRRMCALLLKILLIDGAGAGVTPALTGGASATMAGADTASADAASKTEGPEAAPKPVKGAERLFDDVRMVPLVMGLLNGCAIDVLDVEEWKLSKKSLPSSMRNAMVDGLAGMSWMQLWGIFGDKHKGLFKAVFRSIHVASLVLKRLKRKGLSKRKREGLERVFLAQAYLRGAKYPASDASKTQPWPQWQSLVVAPLREMLKNPLFEMPAGNDAFLKGEEWQKDLAGKRLPRPALNTPQVLLARAGNTAETWAKLLELGQLSGPQVMKNMRSMWFLGLPTSSIEALLMQAVKDSKLTCVDLLNLMRILPSNDRVDELAAKAAKAILKEAACAKKKGTPAPTSVRVETGKLYFKDKTGGVHGVVCKRSIAACFSRGTVNAYQSLLAQLLQMRVDSVTQKAMAAAPQTADKGDQKSWSERKQVSATISYTPELARNGVRRGQPPALPMFASSEQVLWAGECRPMGLVDLQRADTNVKLLCGVSWCQQPKTSKVDLDLSILLFDEDWKDIGYCSYQNLKILGCVHSGDLTSAPYPKGARETVEIDVHALKRGFPTCRRIAILVYIFSGVLDDLADASVFISNAGKAGKGPGGTELITAARMTGKKSGIVYFGGYLDFEPLAGTAAAAAASSSNGITDPDLNPTGPDQSLPPMKLYFYNCNQPLNSTSKNVRSSTKLVKAAVERMVESQRTMPTLKIGEYGAFCAACVADTVSVTGTKPFVLHRLPGEFPVMFYLRIQKAMREQTEPDDKLVYLSNCKTASTHVVFGGTGDDYQQIASDNSTLAAAPGGLVAVNLRSDARTAGGETVKIRSIGKLRRFGGTSSFEDLVATVVGFTRTPPAAPKDPADATKSADA